VPLAAGLLLAGALLALPSLRRLLPAGALRLATGLPATVVTAAFLNMAFFGVDAFVPLMLTAIRGQSIASGGIPLTTATLGWTAGSWLQAHLAPSRGRRLLVESGLAFIALGIGGILAVLVTPVPAWLAALAWGVAGLGMGLAYSPLALIVLREARPAMQGTATSALSLTDSLGTALGTGISGAIVAASVRSTGKPAMGLAVAFTVAVAIGLGGLLLAGRLRPREVPASVLALSPASPPT